ncbi:isocitrate/isopropylmalate family dehydrogenase [Streptomyces thinghirensis]|uniref:Isopropylmalate dehydrogenase-like domain-containing protein n=1 Tax=Streptomyces thinghirensis TaxID=551547 RepID=A0ABP9SZZ6_9ACTN
MIASSASPSTSRAPRTRHKVSSVTKSNAQQYGMILGDDVFKRVAADHPDVETESVLVDAMSAKFLLHPEDLSVVVASNLSADILSDLGSALAGSLGLAAGAHQSPHRRPEQLRRRPDDVPPSVPIRSDVVPTDRDSRSTAARPCRAPRSAGARHGCAFTGH